MEHQLRETLEEMRKLLAVSAFNVNIHAYLLAKGFPEYLSEQEDLLPAIMDLLSAQGIGMAIPSQTLYLGRQK